MLECQLVDNVSMVKHRHVRSQRPIVELKGVLVVWRLLSGLVHAISTSSIMHSLSRSRHMKPKTSSVSRPVATLEYGPTGLSDGAHGELHAAPAYGDLAQGPHGTFIKMPAGYVSPTHTHTDDYWAVVVSGVMVNKAPNSPDVPLSAGSYYFQKGGDAHVTKCNSPNECVFFVSQDGKFDYHE